MLQMPLAVLAACEWDVSRELPGKWDLMDQGIKSHSDQET